MKIEPIKFWATSEHEEFLVHRTIRDAIVAWAEEMELDWITDPMPGLKVVSSIKVYGFSRVEVSPQEFQFLDDLLERLDCDYGAEDGDGPSDCISDKAMKTLQELEAKVCEVLAKNYDPWQCRLVETRTVDPVAVLRGDEA